MQINDYTEKELKILVSYELYEFVENKYHRIKSVEHYSNIRNYFFVKNYSLTKIIYRKISSYLDEYSKNYRTYYAPFNVYMDSNTPKLSHIKGFERFIHLKSQDYSFRRVGINFKVKVYYILIRESIITYIDSSSSLKRDLSYFVKRVKDFYTPISNCKSMSEYAEKETKRLLELDEEELMKSLNIK